LFTESSLTTIAMPDSIPDIILRLAREHAPADAFLAPPPVPPESEIAEHQLDGTAPLPPDYVHGSAGECDPATSASTRHIAQPLDRQPAAAEASLGGHLPASRDSILPPPLLQMGQPPQLQEPFSDTPQDLVHQFRLHVAGGTPAPQQYETADPPPDAESFADVDSAFDQPLTLTPTFTARAGPPQAANIPADDAFQPEYRSETTATNAPDQSPLETVNESSRQLEQTARDLENSLNRLFTTQIEILQSLRDRVDAQERCWVEQQSARRAI
jgi:hypothetical protein